MSRVLAVVSIVAGVVLSGCNCSQPGGPDGGTGGGAGGGTGGSTAADFPRASGAPATGQVPGNFGYGVSLALDAQGNPAVAYGSFDQNGDGDFSDSAIFFAAYDATAKTFKTPVQVAQVGDSRSSVGGTLQLAIDGTHVAVAYLKHTGADWEAWLASSNDGATFTSTQLSAPAAAGVGALSMAMSAGNGHVVWNQGDELHYRGGPLATVSSWTADIAVPLPSGDTITANGAPSVAVDSAGAAGVVFGLNENSTLTYGFWRPGFSVAKVVFATGAGNDTWGVALAFAGTSPRVAMSHGFGSHPDVVSVTTSSDDGATWSAPADLANDGGQIPAIDVTLAASSAGASAVSYGIGGGNLDHTVCGTPKVARSSAFSTWTVCSPAGLGGFDAHHPSVAFTSAGKLVLAFQNVLPGTPLGVLVWREKSSL